MLCICTKCIDCDDKRTSQIHVILGTPVELLSAGKLCCFRGFHYSSQAQLTFSSETCGAAQRFVSLLCRFLLRRKPSEHDSLRAERLVIQ